MAPHLQNGGAHQAGELGEFCDVSGIAKILKVSPSYLNKARVYGGGPPYAKFGAAVRYHIPTVLQWAASRIHHSTSEYPEVA